MGEELKDYLQVLYQRIPSYVYVVLLLILFISIIVVFLNDIKNRWQKLSSFILIEYIFIIYSSTIFFRNTNTVVKYHLYPFQDLESVLVEKPYHIPPEMLMNVIVFVPFGMLLYIVFKGVKWYYVVMFGCVFSMSIEIIQFITRRGTAELDDIFHNSLGVVIGYGLCRMFNKIHKGSLINKRETNNSVS